jgi:drug/metabolite transporter (DMT)-like permease
MTMSARQWALLLLLGVLWGGAFFFNGVAIRELPVLTLVLARVGLAALVLLPVVLWSGMSFPRTFADWTPFIGMSILNNVFPFAVMLVGQQHITSGLTAVLNATTPLWTVILAHVFTRDDRLSVNKLLGVLIGISGVAVLLAPEVGGAGTPGHAFGMACVLLGAVFYGFSALWSRRLRGRPPMLTACCQMICASVMVAPVALLVDQPWLLPMPSLHVIAAVIGLATLSTALGYLVFYRIVTVSGPSNAMLVTLLNPIAAVSAGVIVLGEVLLQRHVVGALVIGSALLVIDGRVIGWLGRASSSQRG